MNRRDFLHYAGLVGMGSMFPSLTNAADLSKTGRTVVLIHLKGGNDGFNTLVPYGDDNYYKLRDNISIKERFVVKLEGANQDGFGMHPQLEKLKPLWQKGQMAWVQGVGYPHSSLSHFQSLDIWESASVNDYSNGWLAQVVPELKQGLHGVIINKGGVEGGGILAGSKLNAVTMQNPASFIRAAKNIKDIEINHRNPAIEHVTKIRHQLHTVGEQIAEKVGASPRPIPGFTGDLGHGLQAVAQMMLSGVDAPVYKVTQGGFDSHASQIQLQNNSLFQLASGISSFAKVMQSKGLWDKVLVVTYSEFGRRAAENRGMGTDHGTASAHMVFGGKVKRGIYGKHPNMGQLDGNGNVAHTTDFRQMYGTIAQNWWRRPNPWGQYGTLPFLG